MNKKQLRAVKEIVGIMDQIADNINNGITTTVTGLSNADTIRNLAKILDGFD
jgi:hypothetical protein